GGSVPSGALMTQNVTFTGVPGVAPQPNSALVNFPLMASGGLLNFLTDTAFSNTSQLFFSAVYFA
ncbi:MAG: hypothetical protein ACREQ5_38685, partial [Candidatus Dormibacteria bacterium]